MSNKSNITNEYLIEWYKNKKINPITKRKIKENGITYKKFKKLYDEFNILDNYKKFRINKIDPILLIELPLTSMTINDLFKFEWKWDPYTGERLNIKDNDGPLYFDPNSLINYFYLNRLNNLWTNGYYLENDFIQGYYGDALGKFPYFEIKGRGIHPEWYLFRLPISDCYLHKNHNRQTITMGPILTNEEIKKIYNLAKKCNNFKTIYNYKLPDLVYIKKLYDFAVKNKYNNEFEYNLNINAVNKLVVF